MIQISGMAHVSLRHNPLPGGREKYVFLVLVLSGKKCILFKYDGDEYHRLENGPESISEVINDAPERVANFTDPKHRKQINIEKFMHQVDKWLGSIEHAEQLPVLLLAPEKVAGRFKKISKNDERIVAYIHGNFDDLTIVQLKKLVEPYIERMRVNLL